MISHDVAKWLGSLDGVRDVVPVKLVLMFKKKEYVFWGAKYTQVNHYTAGMRAVQEGRHNDGEEYTKDGIYLVGEMTKFMWENTRSFGAYVSKYNYRFQGDDGDWFVSCYYQEYKVKPEHKEYHPFGKSFVLSRWPHEEFGERIDHYDTKKHERIPAYLTVE